MITNEKIGSAKLSKIVGEPISKMRRNSKEFLPPDQLATRRSGYSRTFSINDAFLVFIGTHLVSVLGYSFYDAKRIIQDLWPWAESVDLLPEGKVSSEGIDKKIRGYEVRIISDNILGVFHYQILGYLIHNTVESHDDFRGPYKDITSHVYEYDIAPRGKRELGIISPELLSSKILKFTILLKFFRHRFLAFNCA